MSTRTEEESLSFGRRGPSRRTRWLVTLAVAALAAGVVALTVHRRSPAQQPAGRVILAPWSGFGSNHIPSEHRATYAFQLMNLGNVTATITRIGRSGPGLRLVATSAHPVRHHGAGGLFVGVSALPIRVEAYSAVSVMLVYRVSRCDGLAGRAWPIPVTYRTESGEIHTVMVDPGSAGNGPWHRELTSGMCAG